MSGRAGIHVVDGSSSVERRRETVDVSGFQDYIHSRFFGKPDTDSLGNIHQIIKRLVSIIFSIIGFLVNLQLQEY